MLKKYLKEKDNIVCPFCGKQYDLLDIYLLGNFKENKYEEQYICDECSNKFKINMTIKFKTELMEDEFEEETIVSLDIDNKERINLKSGGKQND